MLQREVVTPFRFGGHLACDEYGRLFDRRTRDQLHRVHGDADASLEAMEAVRAIVITAKAIRYVGEHWARRYGLSEVRLQLLLLVRHHPDERLTLGQLARALDLSPRTVTSLVDLLERDRLVARVPHPHDRRATWVRLTGAGRATVDRLWDEMMSRHNPLFDGFTPEEIGELRHLSYKLLLNLARTD